MNEVTTFRLYLLRAAYLLIAVGLGITIWPGLIRHAIAGVPVHAAAGSMLGAVAILAALGIRYPLRMLPLLLFELLWKAIWLTAVALPLWSANQIDAATAESIFACLMGIVIMPIVIPWPYVLANYVRKPGERWSGVARPTAAA
jgi:hypothetical protein